MQLISQFINKEDKFADRPFTEVPDQPNAG
jgi:hypothetical protein